MPSFVTADYDELGVAQCFYNRSVRLPGLTAPGYQAARIDNIKRSFLRISCLAMRPKAQARASRLNYRVETKLVYDRRIHRRSFEWRAAEKESAVFHDHGAIAEVVDQAKAM